MVYFWHIWDICEAWSIVERKGDPQRKRKKSVAGVEPHSVGEPLGKVALASPEIRLARVSEITGLCHCGVGQHWGLYRIDCADGKSFDLSLWYFGLITCAVDVLQVSHNRCLRLIACAVDVLQASHNR